MICIASIEALYFSMALLGLCLGGFALYRQTQSDLRQERQVRALVGLLDTLEAKSDESLHHFVADGLSKRKKREERYRARMLLSEVQQYLITLAKSIEQGRVEFAQKDIARFALSLDGQSVVGVHWKDRLATLANGWLGIYTNSLKPDDARTATVLKIEKLIFEVGVQIMRLEEHLEQNKGSAKISGSIPVRKPVPTVKNKVIHSGHVLANRRGIREGQLLAKNSHQPRFNRL